MAIVIVEDLWWPLPTWLTERYVVVYDAHLHESRERLVAAAEQARALVVRNKTRVDRELLARLPRLEAIGRLGVGLDNIDLAACRERGVTVVTARGCNANAVAEYVIAAMFQPVRFLSRCDETTRDGGWNRERCIGGELHGKTLGLVGVGDIGQRVAVRARALGMQVIAHDPFVSPSSLLVQDFGVQLVSMADVCGRSDFLSLHVPLTSETHHLLGEPELAAMKETAVLINTSRGAIVDETALLAALQQHPRRFAVLDVREQEPPGDDDQLARLPGVLLTPHIAGITRESSERVANLVLGDIDRVLRGEK